MMQMARCHWRSGSVEDSLTFHCWSCLAWTRSVARHFHFIDFTEENSSFRFLIVVGQEEKLITLQII